MDSQIAQPKDPLQLRGIKSPDVRSPVAGQSIQSKFTEDFLNYVGEGVEDEFEPVELYYTKELSSNDKERKIPIMSPDMNIKTLDIQTETEEDSNRIEELNVKMLFFAESKKNNLAIRFQYAFT